MAVAGWQWLGVALAPTICSLGIVAASSDTAPAASEVPGWSFATDLVGATTQGSLVVSFPTGASAGTQLVVNLPWAHFSSAVTVALDGQSCQGVSARDAGAIGASLACTVPAELAAGEHVIDVGGVMLPNLVLEE
ncbi:hypothetical protein Afer_0467 [Acidimicrobium ferrooxidans DSM 10331]|uniref:Uncharacterized protein n=1 Tax=Acidimicrobium ferrooxidans (strain DSM 10331 / JCM 15462 / NBRC 103882 / ICP) TaxID=525909 RepID=C7M341_ACIFD|nr:hypothetical protein Afer_0467 [Acidimicrobium ferrooxidans DSM 10331]